MDENDWEIPKNNLEMTKLDWDIIEEMYSNYDCDDLEDELMTID